MGRLLFFLLLGFGAYLLVKTFSQSGKGPAQKNRKAAGTAMLRCDHCGTYVPEPEALRTATHNYCCEAHKLANEDQPDPE